MTRRTRFGSAALLALAALGGCGIVFPDDPPLVNVCTLEFAFAVVGVDNGSGVPVSDAVITSTLVRTGEVLPASTLAITSPGVYVILDDSAKPRLRAGGDSVRVVARRGTGASISADYLFDVPGGGHVHTVRGPETLVLP